MENDGHPTPPIGQSTEPKQPTEVITDKDPVEAVTVEEPAAKVMKAKLVHTGTKLFWRLKATYEFHIFKLADKDILEMISLNPESEDEPVHMFLSASALGAIVAEEAKQKLAARIKSMAGIRSRAPAGTSFAESDAMLLEEVTLKLIAEFLTNHFNATKDEETGVCESKLVATATEGPAIHRALALLPVPEEPTGAAITRKRRNSTMEINQLMNNLKLETSGLVAATNQATRMVNLGNMAVGGFRAATRLRSKSIDVQNMSPAKIRWQKAIHRVILQNAVSKYTELISKSKSCNPTRVDTPTRGRGNRSTFPASDGFLPISHPGTPPAKPPALDVGGFGETTTTQRPRRATKMQLRQSNSMPLPVVSAKSQDIKSSPNSTTAILAYSPPEADHFLPMVTHKPLLVKRNSKKEEVDNKGRRNVDKGKAT